MQVHRHKTLYEEEKKEKNDKNGVELSCSGGLRRNDMVNVERGLIFLC